MNKFFTLVALLIISNISIASSTVAESVELSSLGKLTLSYVNVTPSSVARGNQLIAVVAEKKGSALTLSTPANIQQISYLLSSGEKINEGQDFAVLKGAEIHHFIAEYKVNKTLLALTKKRFNKNKSLFNKNLIDESKWLTISKNYFETMLEFEHMDHFYEHISSINESEHSVTLKAPVGGVFIRADNNSKLSVGNIIASFIPNTALRLKLQLPASLINTISYVESNTCKLNIANKNQLAVGAFVEVWSETIKDGCQFLLGQKMMVYPFLKQQAYVLPKSAVFSLAGSDKVFIKIKQQLKSVDVSLLSSVGNNYLLSSQTDLNDTQVLTTSVSAVQGVLMGLGGE